MTPAPVQRDRPAFVIAILVAVALTTIATVVLIARRQHLPATKDHNLARTRAVMINLLPATVDVTEKVAYSHPFSIPDDATNAHIEGEFTVEPRPQGQLDLLLVSAEEMQHWQKFLSSPTAQTDPAGSGLIYRSGDTIAARFDVQAAPGNYYLIFDFGPAASTTTDHFGGGVAGPAYRQARPQISLNYDLPCETCP